MTKSQESLGYTYKRTFYFRKHVDAFKDVPLYHKVIPHRAITISALVFFKNRLTKIGSYYIIVRSHRDVAKRLRHQTLTLALVSSNLAIPARKKTLSIDKVFFQRNKSLTGFVKCTSCVKYASRVKCAAAREGICFISHCDEVAIFHSSRSELFHRERKRTISLNKVSVQNHTQKHLQSQVLFH